VFVSSFTPGPNNFMVMMIANKHGMKKTIPFCLGVSAGFFIIAWISSYFHLLLKNVMPKIEITMTLFGAIYMLYLAFKIVMSREGDTKSVQNKQLGFLAGMLLQFINPKGILYGLTVMGTFILPYYSTHFSLLLFSVFLGFVSFLSSLSWSAFGSLFQKYLSAYRTPFNIVMALLLVYSAIAMFVK
jgi:threonine/homoserine/homoserine lactone efflux protein